MMKSKEVEDKIILMLQQLLEKITLNSSEKNNKSV